MKEKVTKVSKNAKPRTILIKCYAAEYVAKLLNYFSDQLADADKNISSTKVTSSTTVTIAFIIIHPFK